MSENHFTSMCSIHSSLSVNDLPISQLKIVMSVDLEIIAAYNRILTFDPPRIRRTMSTYLPTTYKFTLLRVPCILAAALPYNGSYALCVLIVK